MSVGSDTKRMIGIKQVYYILLVVFIISLVPILAMGFSCFPCADDFSFGASTHAIWKNSHNIFAVIAGAIKVSAEKYYSWQGTYTSIFFMALQPAVFSYKMYVITPFIMCGMLIVSTEVFIRSIFRYVAVKEKYIAGIVSIIILEVMLQGMVSPVEGLYWFNGAVHYIVPLGFMFLLMGTYISMVCDYERGETKHLVLKFIISIICGLFVGGGNLVSGLVMSLLAVSVMILCLLYRHFKEYKLLNISCIIYLVFFILNMIAPGNQVRGSSMEGMSAVKSIAVAFFYALTKPIEEWTTWLTLAGIILIAIVIYPFLKIDKVRFSHPILVALYSYCLLASTFVPGLYSVGNSDAGRIQNLIYMLYILLLFVNEIYIIGWAKSTICRENENESEGLNIFSVVLISFMIFAYGLTFVPSPEKYLSGSAVYEIMTGQTGDYKESMNDRFKILDSDAEDVRLPSISSQPYLLFYSDISDDGEDWTNKAMARFYDKKTIVREK